jgi:hypothetical protein
MDFNASREESFGSTTAIRRTLGIWEDVRGERSELRGGIQPAKTCGIIRMLLPTSDLYALTLIERLAYGLLLYVVPDGSNKAVFAGLRGLRRLRVIRSGRIAHEDRLALRGIRP